MKSFQEIRVTLDIPPTVAGTSTLTGTILDMADWDAVAFFLITADVTSACVLSVEARGSDTADGLNDVQVTGSQTTPRTCGATDTDNALLVSDVVRPAKRYLFAKVIRSTANAAIGGVLAIQYRRSVGGPTVTQPGVLLMNTVTPEV